MKRHSTLPLLSALSLSAGALLVSGCQYSAFDTYEENAPIRVIPRPDNFRGQGLGNVLAAQSTELSGKRVGRLYSSAGPNTSILVTRAWDGDSVSEESFVRCRKAGDCKAGTNVGAALIPFDVWAYESRQEKEACAFAPAAGHSYVFCESGTVDYPLAGDDYEAIADVAKSTLLFAGSGLPAGHPLGIVLLGAHTVTDRENEPSNGRLFYQPAFSPATASGGDVPALELVPLVDPGTGELFSDAEDAGNFGYAVSSQLVDDVLWIAIAQPSRERVILATFDDSLPGEPSDKFQTRACIGTPDPDAFGFGKRLVLGDVTGDGAPELFVGIDPIDQRDVDLNGDKQRVWMYPGSGLPSFDEDATRCPAWDEEPVQVGCIGGIRGVSCEGTAFGASFAVGDVDADGFGDLIVGAPYAAVQGGSASGAAWIIPGSSEGLDLDAMTNVFATKAKNAFLGLQVAALRTQDRDEPVASAPGEDRTYVFMCTKLEDDVSSARMCLAE